MGKSCGGCHWFRKLKNDKFSSGICDLRDGRTNTDNKCELWQGIKYDRNKGKEYEDE